jgi:hypothetical protein
MARGPDRLCGHERNVTLNRHQSDDAEPPNEFQRVADGEAAFRTADLLSLCDLLDWFRGADYA